MQVRRKRNNRGHSCGARDWLPDCCRWRVTAWGQLPLYWSEPDRRFPFLVRCGHLLAGFAFVTRGSPVSDDSNVLDSGIQSTTE